MDFILFFFAPLYYIARAWWAFLQADLLPERWQSAIGKFIEQSAATWSWRRRIGAFVLTVGLGVVAWVLLSIGLTIAFIKGLISAVWFAVLVLASGYLIAGSSVAALTMLFSGLVVKKSADAAQQKAK